MDQHLDSFNEILKAHEQQQFDRALELSLEAIQEIPELVKDTIAEYGEWNEKSLPALEYALDYLPVLRRRDDLQKIKELLISVPELADWVSEVEYAFKLADVMDRIESLIREEPGYNQDNLSLKLDISSRDLNNLLYRAEQLGLIKREKHRNSYLLELVKSK